MEKKYLFGIKLLMIGISFLASSCEPVYIPDPIDPRLPKYTNDGNNVAGALINNVLWKSENFVGLFSSNDEPQINYYSDRDSIAITFFGYSDGVNYYTDISFGFRGYNISSLAGLKNLNEIKIQLDGINSMATLYRFSDCQATVPGTGQLYFRSIKYDDQNKIITLSGTFGFNQNDPLCENKVVTYGRFDFTVVNFNPM